MSELTINKLEKMPKVKAKTTTKKGDVRKLLEQFDKENMKYAEIPETKDHTVKGIMISLGRIVKTDKRTDIEVFKRADEKAVILKRK